MKFTLPLAFLFFSGATAFAPAAKTTQSTALHALNGWEPDGNKFTYGLPGAVAPFEKGFDPFGIAGREDVGTLKTFRESEVTHGRVAMLAGTFNAQHTFIEAIRFWSAYDSPWLYCSPSLLYHCSCGLSCDGSTLQLASSL